MRACGLAKVHLICVKECSLSYTQGPLHKRTEAVAKIIMGDDAAFDFDHMISKVKTLICVLSTERLVHFIFLNKVRLIKSNQRRKCPTDNNVSTN